MGGSPQLHASRVIGEIKKNSVTHIVWLPSSETASTYQAMMDEPSIHCIPVCREGESMAIATGLWVGGKKPVVMIQNTGFFESGDSIRGLCLDVGVPLVILVGYRGYTRHGLTRDSAARFIEPVLNAWQINYYLVESDEDMERISLAFEEAQRTSRPVAVLIGKEAE